MTHKGSKYIETERLILRPFKLVDAEPMFYNWANDDEVTKYMTWTTQTDISQAKETVAGWVNRNDNNEIYHWAIVPKDNNDQPIGSISVVNTNENTEAMEIGYCIGRKWWHQGITTDALQAVIDYLFSEVGVNRISARHDPNNPNLGKVMVKCGMQYEGTLRQVDKNNTGICDAAYYSILKAEWQK